MSSAKVGTLAVDASGRLGSRMRGAAKVEAAQPKHFSAKIAKNAKTSWVIPWHRMGSARIFPMRPGASENSLAGLGVLCVLCVSILTVTSCFVSWRGSSRAGE